MADDQGINARLAVQLSADLSQLRKAFQEAGKAADGALLGIEQRGERAKRRLTETLELIRLQQQLQVARAGGKDDVAEQLSREIVMRRTINDLTRQGVKAEAARAEAAAHVAALDQARNSRSKGSAFSSSELMELEHVARSAFDALASGANPIRVLTMEGGRMAQAFGNAPGGIGGALTGLLKLINPSVVAFGTIAAVILAATAAEMSFESEQRKTVLALLSTAAASGLTVQSINDVVRATAELNHQSETTNRNLVRMFAGAGVEGVDNIKRATALSEDYAVSIGEKVPAAAQKLGQALDKPAQGVKTLNEELRGFISGPQMELIQRLDESGRKAEAQKIILDALQAAVRGNANEMTGLNKMLRDIATGFDNAKLAAGGFIAQLLGYHGLDDLPQLRARRDYLQRQASNPQLSDSERAGARQQLTETNATLAPLETQQRVLDQKSSAAKENQASQHLQDLINNADPQRARIERLQSEVNDLAKAVADPSQRHGQSLDELQRALVGAKTNLARAQRRETHMPGVKATPADRTDQMNDSAAEAQSRAAKDVDEAQARLATSINARADAEAKAIDAETTTKLTALSKEEASIRSRKNDANAKGQIAALEAAKADEKIAEQAKLELVQRNRLVSLIEEAAKLAQSESQLRQEALQRQEDTLHAEAQLAMSTRDRNKLEQQALAAAQAREREEASQRSNQASLNLMRASASGSSADIQMALEQLLSAQNAQAALPARQQLQTRALAQQQQSPMQQWVTEGKKSAADVGDAIQSQATHAMDEFNRGVADAIVNGKNLGSVMKSIFADMESALVQYLLKQAEIAILLGAGSSGAAGGGAGLFSTLGSFIFGGAHADGGRLGGSGGPRSDNLLIRASPGEYVVNAKSTSKYAPLLDLLNSDRMPKFADGGMVGVMSAPRAATAAALSLSGNGGAVVHQHFTLDARGAVMTEDLVKGMQGYTDAVGQHAAMAGAVGGHKMTMDKLSSSNRNRLR